VSGKAKGTGGVADESTRTTVNAAVTELTKHFRAAGFATPDLDARLLVCHACNLSREAYILEARRDVSDAEAAAIQASAARRLAYEPVSRIIGQREFYGLNFVIAPSVLDPRPETETLVDAALGLLKVANYRPVSPRLLDLGTGSGCILLSLLAELPDAWGIGIDIDPAALRIASRNARALSLTERSAFACMDWTAALKAQFDLIVSNPPYIATSDIVALAPEVGGYDPFVALDGGVNGLSAYRRLARDAYELLRPGGWILLEAGAEQSARIIDIFSENEWFSEQREWQLFRDLAGINRVVAIKRQSDR
jgi:release factor glutamine methyltransferase